MDERLLGQLVMQKRNVGRTLAACRTMAEQLKQDLTIGIMDMDENGAYTNRVVKILGHEFKVHVVASPIFKLVPPLPFKPVYDRFSEIIGSEPVLQTKVLVGYKLRQFDIDNDWHPNETF